MTYSPETSVGHESAKIASLVVPYLQGKFLDCGCGNSPVWPSAIGIDNYTTFGNATGIKCDVADLSIFTDSSIDAVFSSHTLEDFERHQVPVVLQEWTRVLKAGGYLVLYLPSSNLYPKCKTEGANVDHKWDIYPGDMERILREQVSSTCGWEIVESQERGTTNEYSILFVAKKLAEKGKYVENLWQRNPDGKKRCLVIRYGAYGDSIQTSSIFPHIKAQGYHLTVNLKPESYDVLKLDPNVDEWLIQGENFVPNVQLGPYWESLTERYDRIINLCEVIEGALLALPGRLQHQYPDDVRRNMFGTVNYIARKHQVAGVSQDPADFNPRFYASEQELKKARALKKAYGGGVPVIVWALAGSSPHKIYPYPQVVIKWLVEQTNFHIVLVGDKKQGAPLQEGLLQPLRDAKLDLSHVHSMCGKWTIRESLAFAMVADVVVGPETGVLNAVAHEDNAKVLMLSHSSKMNLSEYWKNTVTLEPHRDFTPCFPCHRMHNDWTHCHQSARTHAALCASNISPEDVYKAIAEALGVAPIGEAA